MKGIWHQYINTTDKMTANGMYLIQINSTSTDGEFYANADCSGTEIDISFDQDAKFANYCI